MTKMELWLLQFSFVVIGIKGTIGDDDMVVSIFVM